MNKLLNKKLRFSLLAVLCVSLNVVYGQTEIKGKVSEAGSSDGMSGVTVFVGIGTIYLAIILVYFNHGNS